MGKKATCFCLSLSLSLSLSLLALLSLAGCSTDQHPAFSGSDPVSNISAPISEESDSHSENHLTTPTSTPLSSQNVSSHIDSTTNSNSSSISSGEQETITNKYSKPYEAKINTTTGFDENLTGKNVFLTFDDGPSGNNTPRVLATLKKYNIKATFFVCGPDSPTLRAMIKQEFEDGHTIGIHCYSHYLNKLYHSDDNYWEDFNRIESIVHEVTGTWPSVYRFPGGTNNEYIRKSMSDRFRTAIEKRGYLYYDWNVSSHDSSAPPAEVIINNILSDFNKRANAKGPSIVLMHDSSGRPTTADALETVIIELNKKGCIFGPLNHTVTPVQFIKY